MAGHCYLMAPLLTNNSSKCLRPAHVSPPIIVITIVINCLIIVNSNKQLQLIAHIQ